jgi:uncharacterized membrane protein
MSTQVVLQMLDSRQGVVIALGVLSIRGFWRTVRVLIVCYTRITVERIQAGSGYADPAPRRELPVPNVLSNEERKLFPVQGKHREPSASRYRTDDAEKRTA